MATIELGPAPAVSRGSLRDALDWARIVVATLARGVVITLLGMALWAAAPAVIGWHPTTVMTGSMEPRLAPGDVVVSRPVAPADLKLGQVVLYDDPDQPGELRMHRIHTMESGGMLVTKGDANPQPDSTPINRSAVHGVAFIRVPYIGLPIVWLRDGEWHALVLLVLAVTAIAWLATIDGSLRRDGDPSIGSPSGGADGGLEARIEAAPAATITRREYQRRLRAVRRLKRGGTALLVVVAVAGGGAFLPAKALAATFSGKDTNPTSSWTATTAVAPTALTCTNNADKTVTIGWAYSGATPAGFDALNGSTVVATASSGTARSVVISGSGSLNLGTTSAITVRTKLTSSWTATSTTSVNVKTTGVLGAVTATCA
jgi:signal peptidase I